MGSGEGLGIVSGRARYSGVVVGPDNWEVSLARGTCRGGGARCGGGVKTGNLRGGVVG